MLSFSYHISFLSTSYFESNASFCFVKIPYAAAVDRSAHMMSDDSALAHPANGCPNNNAAHQDEAGKK